MDIRYITNPYMSMDDISKPWDVNNNLIINLEYLKQVREELQKEIDENKKENLILKMK